MTQGRKIVEGTTDWFFFSGGPGAPRYGDDPTKHAVDHDAESFVREVVQNANDQRLDNEEPVGITFRFRELTGEDRAEFLDALGWGDGLEDHLGAVAESDSGRGYRHFLDRVRDREGELRLLTVEDRNTTGLTGRWSDDSNYAALVRDELYSSKQDENAGGSYGIGKSVLWTFSGASTVLFNSRPTEVPADTEPPRFVGRTKLPTHELDGVTYQGAGWYCEPHQTDDGTRPGSIWGDRASELAERLHFDRGSVSGTSLMVVGFGDPTREVRPDLDDLADEFVEAAAKYFWPAIHRGDLEVTVETPEEEHEAHVDDVEAIRPFVECFDERHADTEPLEQPGDVSGLDVPVGLPPRADGSETPDGEVRLAARLASPADDHTYLNHVALFRGAGMVVKYYDQSRVAFGDRNFHGVLACGEARTDGHPTEGDLEVDRFLRYAEPPEHDEWESTENLRERYQRGFRKALDEMFGTLRDGLRHLVSRTGSSSDTLSKRVRKRFPIHDEMSRPTSVPEPRSVFDIESRSGYSDGRWTFEGQIEPLEEEFDGWTAEISMQGVGEDGGTFGQVPIDSVSTSDDVTVEYRDGNARIVAGDDVKDLEFRGESRPVDDGHASTVTVGETRLEIRAELRTREGEE